MSEKRKRGRPPKETSASRETKRLEMRSRREGRSIVHELFDGLSALNVRVLEDTLGPRADVSERSIVASGTPDWRTPLEELFAIEDDIRKETPDGKVCYYGPGWNDLYSKVWFAIKAISLDENISSRRKRLLSAVDRIERGGRIEPAEEAADLDLMIQTLVMQGITLGAFAMEYHWRKHADDAVSGKRQRTAGKDGGKIRGDAKTKEAKRRAEVWRNYVDQVSLECDDWRRWNDDERFSHAYRGFVERLQADSSLRTLFTHNGESITRQWFWERFINRA